VVERNVRQHDDARAQHVRRIVAAAEPGLHDSNVDLRLGECEQRCGGQCFELRRAELDGLRLHARDGVLEVRLLAADPDSLAPAAHVRREIRADRDSRVDEQRLGEARRRRLAVGADDVHGRVARLRIAERTEELAHAPDPEAIRRPRVERRDPITC
jgi:hypothetical protein